MSTSYLGPPLHVVSYARLNAPKAHAREITWEKLCEKLSTHAERSQKDGALWSPVRLKELHRLNDNVTLTYAFVADVDDYTDPEEYLAGFAEEGLAYLAYSTYSHHPERPKFRVVLPFARPVTAEEHGAVWRGFAHVYGHIDPVCKDRSRAYFTPACPPPEEREGDPWVRSGGGKPLDPDFFIALAPPPPPPRPPQELVFPMNGHRPNAKIILERSLTATTGKARHYRGFHLAEQLRDNRYTEAEAAPVVLELQRQLESEGDHPYSEREALSSLAYAYRKPARDPWPEKPLPTLSQAAARDFREVTTEAAKVGDTPARPVRYIAQEISRMTLRPPAYVVPNLIVEGLNIMAGPPKIGKTWLALALGIAVASEDGYALGSLPVEHGAVLGLFLEDPLWRLQSRMRQLLQGSPASERFFIFNEWPQPEAGGLQMLREEMERVPDLKLVIIDPLARLMTRRPDKGNPYHQDYAEMVALKRIADQRHAAVLPLHHLNKLERDDPLEQISGTMGIAGGVDAALVLKRPRGSTEGTLFVTGRDVEERELALRFAPEIGTWSLLGEAAQVRMSDERRALVTALAAIGGWGTGQDLAASMGRDLRSIRTLIARSLQTGTILASRGGYALPAADPRLSPD